MQRTRIARNVAVSTVATAVMLGLAACSGGSSAAPAAPTETPAASSSPVSSSTALLASAARTLNATKAVHLRLTSSHVPATGTKLVSGRGTMVRAASTGAFRGSVSVMLDGNPVTVPVVSTAGKVYIKIPGRTKYQVTNPAGFGVSDPAKLLDPNTGISQLFSKLEGVTSRGSRTLGGTTVEQVQGIVPGTLVSQLLAGVDPSEPVTARLSIDPATGQLRRAVLRGPFFAAGRNSTYTLDLSGYGKTVTITAPAA